MGRKRKAWEIRLAGCEDQGGKAGVILFDSMPVLMQLHAGCFATPSHDEKFENGHLELHIPGMEKHLFIFNKPPKKQRKLYVFTPEH